MFLKRFLISLVLVISNMTVSDYSYSAPKRGKTTRKASTRTKTKRAANNSTAQKNNPETTELTPATADGTVAPVATTTQQTGAPVATQPDPTQNLIAISTEVILTDEQKMMEVPNFKEWKDFRLCMQQTCSGGADQPLNVECYKNMPFDNAFQKCQLFIGDINKNQLYSDYFKGPFLKAEREAACKSNFAGTYVKETDVCNVAVTFTRKYESKAKGLVKNNEVGCNDTVTKTFPIDGKNRVCSYESFGLQPCYSDNANTTANEIGAIMGIVQMTAGVAIGAVGAVGAISNANASVRETVSANEARADKIASDSGTSPTEKSIGDKAAAAGGTVKKDAQGYEKIVATGGDQWAAGLSGGLESGGSMIVGGAGQLTQAMVMKGQVGPEVKGRCTLPNTNISPEGTSINLSW